MWLWRQMKPMNRRRFPAGVLRIGLEHFTDEEISRYEAGGYGQVLEPGDKLAVVVVDATYEFCGRPAPSPSEEWKSPDSSARKAIDNLVLILEAARGAGIPIIYSKNQARIHPAQQGSWAWKTLAQATGDDLEIVREVAPQPGDLVVEKTKPSAFFGTALASYITSLGVDTLLITGSTTSGCVRATVVDAFSNNLRAFVVVDCVFDRSRTSHEVNLFEMQQKYAGLVEAKPLIRWMEGFAPANY